jgi:Asp-tRNA(Asn)/Glu-tRNA(Gln) amidotransferase A subunit family amidase
MSKLDELSFADATTLADPGAAQGGRPVELVDSAIERLKRLNPKLNAVVTPLYEHARRLSPGDARLPGGTLRKKAGTPLIHTVHRTRSFTGWNRTRWRAARSLW